MGGKSVEEGLVRFVHHWKKQIMMGVALGTADGDMLKYMGLSLVIKRRGSKGNGKRTILIVARKVEQFRPCFIVREMNCRSAK